jgi:trehalose synthase
VLQRVTLGHKHLADYASIQGRSVVARIRELAEPLAGLRLLHLSATAFGGGVSEILYTLVPLMRDAGIDADWGIIAGDDPFFEATKATHNALQGDPASLTSAQREAFMRTSEANAEALRAEIDRYDAVVVHDPQPVFLRPLLAESRARWIWRCHIDLSDPNPDVLEFLLPAIGTYDAAIFHMPEFVPDVAGLPPVRVQPPAIDPLAPKNMALARQDAAYIVGQFGVDVERPLIVQVSRFDPWKDPLGVIDAYRGVKERHPDVQLGLVGSMAHDDPEGMEYFRRTMEHAAGDPDVLILSNLNSVGAVEVNAFQVIADVVVQKSLREGFGLTVTEALWKGRPVVAGDVGGIRSQIVDGQSGFLVGDPESCARRCAELLDDRALGVRLGGYGKEVVRERFLMPRKLERYLELLHDLDVTAVRRAGAEADAA